MPAKVKGKSGASAKPSKKKDTAQASTPPDGSASMDTGDGRTTTGGAAKRANENAGDQPAKKQRHRRSTQQQAEGKNEERAEGAEVSQQGGEGEE